MDSSCSSSPSHSFKDRPRSSNHGGGGGDLPRQASFPHALERAKSPAGKGAPDSRDPIRRSYADGVEKTAGGGDGAVSCQDRSRGGGGGGPLRRPFGAERQRDPKAEMARSARPCSVWTTRNSERETGEGRLDSRRSGYGESSSPLPSERESSGCKAASKKGYDREGGDGKWSTSASPEADKETSKSFLMVKGIVRNDSKESYKLSPNVSTGQQPLRKDIAPDKDCSLSFHGKKEVPERGKFSPPRKASAREMHDDVDAVSVKTKASKFRDLDKLKEQEVNSNVNSSETEAAWNRGLSSRPREDMLDGEQLHEDTCRESPVSFLHVSKKARSDRDRGRRDDHVGKSSGRYSQWNEFMKVDAHKASSVVSNYDSPVKKNVVDDKERNVMHEPRESEELSARNVDTGVMHAIERPSENPEKEHRLPISEGNSDMEEGELEPESDSMATPGFGGENSATVKKADEIKRETCSVIVKEPNGKELCGGESKVGTSREEDKLMVNGDEVRLHVDRDNKNSNVHEKIAPPVVKEEAQSEHPETDPVNMPLTSTSLQISANNVLELGESSRAGVLYDLLGSKGKTNDWNVPSSADTNIEPSKELTLSLFTNPNQTGGGSSESTKDNCPNGSNGKHIVKPQSSDAGGGDGSSQLSGHRQNKLKLESLQLSLALPGSSNIAGVPDALAFAAPAEPSRSFQSFNQTQTHTQNFLQSQTYTNSDGFTSSFSFSQSESFLHNPSCSLNCTSFENQELSCGGTRQLSQGAEHMSNRSWPALSGNEQGMHTVTSVSHDKSKHRRGIPLYQRALQNGSMNQGLNQGFPSVTGSNRSSGSNHFSQKSYYHGQRLQEAPKILDSSSQDLDGSMRQVTTCKDNMERVRQTKAYFASRQQAMSAEALLVPTAAKDRDKPEDRPSAKVKGTTAAEKDIATGERTSVNEKIGLHEISVEPIAIMAQKLQEWPDSFLEGLKGVARGVLSSFEKRDEFLGLQENIRRRKDLTEDSLLRAHRTQLEILVALKTGCESFVQEGSKLQTYKVLIEIFLETRCRNVACQQPLLSYECECRVCSKKSGYCRECMCFVCLKFDLDNGTCRWLGCDLCLHWCHTDCALRMSYIAPTLTDKSLNNATEMQYHCVSCDHKSELYGFVKAVFQSFAENWGAEALAKELDCVRKIFHGSEDMRGKQLCWKAEQMLQKLENKVDAMEVCRSMLRYLNEGNAELDGACGPIKRSSSLKATADISSRMSEPARESIPKALASSVIKSDTDNTRAVIQKLERNAEEKRTETTELQYDRARKRAEIEEMESEIRIKQAEAKMFQSRADEARHEAGGLERIISVKKEKIDEEYAGKYAKLRLSEAEERHKKRFEELKALENAQQDFQKMKVRMEAEIKELMLKMEMAKRQFT